MIRLGKGEPAAGPWKVVSLDAFADGLRSAAGAPVGRPPVVAIDGRSASGKTTLSGRLADVMPGSAVVHSDDLAWWFSAFGWAALMADEVLAPIGRGESVDYRPPGWVERGRPGSVIVSAAPTVLIIEGVGVGRRELAPLLDVIVYVQADVVEASRRDSERVAAGEISPSEHALWVAEETLFVADQRPWERATAIVAGTPDLPYDPVTQVVMADGPLVGVDHGDD